MKTARITVTLIGISLAAGCNRSKSDGGAGAMTKALLADGGTSISGMLSKSGGKVIPSRTVEGAADPGHTAEADAAVPALSKELVASVLNPDNLPEYTGPTGTVEGDVFVVGPDAPSIPDLDFKGCPGADETFGKLFRTGPQVGTEAGQPKRPLADAVVVVTEYKGFVPARVESQTLIISERCEIPSRTLTLTFGQRLKVGNMSTELFGPELSGVPTVTVRIAPPRQSGDPVELVPPHPGFFSMKDAFHTFFHADLYVMPHPFHTVSDRRGHFRIEGIPVGTVKVNARLVAIARATQAGPSELPKAGDKRRTSVSATTESVEIRAGEVSHTSLVLQYAPASATPQPILPPAMP